jgi:hypothetical protein
MNRTVEQYRIIATRSHDSLACSYAQGGLDELVGVLRPILQFGPEPSGLDPRPQHV